MALYSYPSPMAPQYEKPTSVEDCLPHARIFVKKEHGRAAMGPVKKGDKILFLTYPDQDEYVSGALTQALKEEGADKVEFVSDIDLRGYKTNNAEQYKVYLDYLNFTIPNIVNGVDFEPYNNITLKIENMGNSQNIFKLI